MKINVNLDTVDFQRKMMQIIQQRSLTKLYVKHVANRLKQQQTNNNSDITSKGTSIDVNIQLENAENNNSDERKTSFMDLKPFFARSSKAKPTKNGKGWYLVVPLRVKTKALRPLIGSNGYKALQQLNFGQTGIVNNLNELGNNQEDVISPLQYQWKGNNITREQYGNSERGEYISFRTVSNKSDPSSWIENRQEFKNNNTSPQEVQQINNILKQRLLTQIEM